MSDATSDRPRGPLERFLALFADVRGGEGIGVVLLAVNAFLLLAAYYTIKPLREGLILGGAGPEVKSYTSAGQALLLLLVIPAYGRIASRVSRIRLITWVTLFFISNLIVFYALGQTGLRHSLGIPFYIWVGIFNVMIVAQFWGFANDVYSPEQGKRLFAMVAVGSSTGAIFGTWVAKPLIKVVGLFPPMLIAGAILVACILISRSIHRRAGAAHGAQGEVADQDQPIGQGGGFQLVLRERYLLLIAFLVLLLNAVNTTGEYILGKAVTAAADAAATGTAAGASADFKERFIGVFYADYQFYVNLAGALAQAFLVSRIMKWVGVRISLFFLPLIALGGYALIATAPLLGLIRVIKAVKIAENATDYSLNNTVRHSLFLPTSREAKYKAKAAIDSFFWRMGDLVSAGLVFVGSLLRLGPQSFAWANFALTLLWLWVVMRVAREHRRITGEEAAPAPAEAATS